MSVWADSMGTMMMWFEGDCMDAGRVTTMTSEFLDPMTGKKSKMKTVTTVQSADKMLFEGYMPGPDGKEFKSMEIVYTRQ